MCDVSSIIALKLFTARLFPCYIISPEMSNRLCKNVGLIISTDKPCHRYFMISFLADPFAQCFSDCAEEHEGVYD